jgi:hypothetical protein
MTRSTDVAGPQSAKQQSSSPRASLALAAPSLIQRAGNAGMQALLRKHGVQRWSISGEHDPLEHEADRVAAAVVQRMSVQGPHAGAGSAPRIQRACSQCEEEQINRAAIGNGPATVSDGELDRSVSSLIAGGGRPLPNASLWGAAFGHDFSAVRVHTGPDSHALMRSIDAKAATFGGNHIAFGEGFKPDALDHLTAHELTHVVQQGGATPLA